MPAFPSNAQQGQSWTDPQTGTPWIYMMSPGGYPLWAPNTQAFQQSYNAMQPTGGFPPAQGNSGFNFNLPTVPISSTSDMSGGNGGGFFNPAGGWQNGSPTGDFGTQGGGGGGGMPFWQQLLLNTGVNLAGGWLQNRAISGAQKQSQKQIEDRIRQALATLSPEHISALAQQFLPQMAANNNVAGQTAIQAVREQAARTGQLEGPRALSFEAGTRAKLAGDTQRQAFEQAMNLSGSQAGAITGAPYTPIQPQTGYAQAITNSANQAYGARFYQQANQQNQTGVPYRYPGMGGWGNQGSYGWGGY